MSRPPPRIYRVTRIEGPWLSGSGFLCGLPTVLVEFGMSGEVVTADAISRRVKIVQERTGDSSPRWVALRGDTAQADDTLCARFRAVNRLLSCVEADGTAAMGGDRDLPMWDHVALRVRLPIPDGRIRTELFHSVTVLPPTRLSYIREFAAYLRTLAYNGPCYVEGEHAAGRVARLGGNWRVTRPAVAEGELRRAIPEC